MKFIKIYKLTCNIFYLRRTNGNFNTRFEKKTQKGFRFTGRNPDSPDHLKKEGYEMKTIEKIIAIMQIEINPRKINTRMERNIPAKKTVNGVINGRNDPV